MNRPRNTWLLFVLCSMVVLLAMGRVSLTALRLENEQFKAAQQSEVEARVRLALWRMDAALTALMIEESARPVWVYEAPIVSGTESKRRGGAGEEQTDGGSLRVTPLLAPSSSNTLLYFQYDRGSKLSSPQCPQSGWESLLRQGLVDLPSLVTASNRLAALGKLLSAPARGEETNQSYSRGSITVQSSSASRELSNGEILLHESGVEWRAARTQEPGSALSQVFQQVVVANADPREMQQAQALRNQVEFNVRANVYQQTQQRGNWRELESAGGDGRVGVFKPVWIEGEVFLVRRVERAGVPAVQGVWLDWKTLRSGLLEAIRDLFPSADLVPRRGGEQSKEARLLAAIPAVLKPGPVPMAPLPLFTPVRLMLGMAWIGVLVAAVAVALLLHGTLSLSERRAAFVSAVTHELRTPLTTFRMYSEMLAEDMVPSAERRREYLQTLCLEANRLSHLVENVLAYARLERGGSRGRIEAIRLGDLVARLEPRLAQRARQSEMELRVEATSEALDQPVYVDVSAVEQILFNLVDNACKYAAPNAEERTIHLEVWSGDRHGILRVRDHGRGIRGDADRQLFKPFHKSADEAARTAPGVGLGLALCRRLSRSMGGDLRLVSGSEPGACLELRLPLRACAGAAPAIT